MRVRRVFFDAAFDRGRRWVRRLHLGLDRLSASRHGKLGRALLDCTDRSSESHPLRHHFGFLALCLEVHPLERLLVKAVLILMAFRLVDWLFS